MTLSRISLQLVAIGMVFFLSCTLIYMAASRPTSLIRERTFQTHNNDPLSMRHHSLSVQPLLHVDEPGNNPMWNIWNRTLGVSIDRREYAGIADEPRVPEDLRYFNASSYW